MGGQKLLDISTRGNSKGIWNKDDVGMSTTCAVCHTPDIPIFQVNGLEA